MPRPFSGSGFFPPPPTTPEAYAALIAFFDGDQAAADAYLAQLEGYADDGDDAQALLDAAVAAGDVATAITILEGGGPQTFAQIAAGILDADCVALILPSPDIGSPYIEDLSGTFGAVAFNTALTIITGTEAGGYGARSSTSTNPVLSGPVQIVGELTVHLVITDFSVSGAGHVASVSSAGESEANNYLWSLAVASSAYIYFAETGPGSNISAEWTRTTSVTKSRTVLVSITRSSSGRVILYENGSPLVCYSASGGSVGPGGAYADLPLPTGGSGDSLYISADPSGAGGDADIMLVGIYNVEQSPSKVLEIAQTLGFA